MAFTPQTYSDFGVALTALEQRIADAFAAVGTANIRTKRVAVPAMAANTLLDVNVTWATPFADANYTVAATVEDPVSNAVDAAIMRQIRSRSATGCVLRISNGGAAQPANEQTLHVIAVHD